MPLLFLALLPSISLSQMYNTQVEAKIDMEHFGDTYIITGSSVNKTGSYQSLRYVISVIKNGLNTSENDQEARFILETGEKKNIASITLNVNDKDRIIILLLVYDEEDNPLGMDRLVINGTEEDLALEKRDSIERKKAINTSPDATFTADDGIVLRGIVTEDTKTKPGRDFYKMFYSLYSENNINGEEIVVIKEVLSLNNNTKIEIFVANEKVLEFFARPQNEYLKAMSEVAIKRVYWYLQKYMEGKNIQKYY